MAAQIGSQSEQDDERLSLEIGGHPHVFDCHHDIIFLEGLRVLGNLIKLPKICLRLLELYHYQLCIGSGAGKVLLRQGVPRSNGGQEGAVAVGVLGGYKGKGGIRGEGLVDLCPGKFGPIAGSAGCAVVRHAGSGGGPILRKALVPDSGDSGGPVGVEEERIGVIDACVNNADENALPSICQGGRVKNSGDAGSFQASSIQKGENTGYTIVGIPAQGNGGCIFQRSIDDGIVQSYKVRTENVLLGDGKRPVIAVAVYKISDIL